MDDQHWVERRAAAGVARLNLTIALAAGGTRLLDHCKDVMFPVSINLMRK